MKDVTDDRVRVYVIWDPIYGGNFDDEARKLSRGFRDKRVRYFKDPDSLAGKQWEQVLNTQREIAWDVYLLYGADAQWNQELPKPDYWMHQLFGVTTAPFMNTQKLTEELKGMMAKAQQRTTEIEKSQRSGLPQSLTIELLYFDSCPSYTKALANIRDALRETHLKAHLKLTNVDSEAKAQRVGFQGSPSIRINGKDLEGRDEGFSFSCRLYRLNGTTSNVPSKETIKAKLESMMR
ncbi:MAG TPA: hypothetical protein VKN18_13450 [Blastocatellia bacterium]|nr:hypothetical protein [Blastocatellia bacterium]